ncbi:MAG: nucleoside triphosphate pyrophosphohydrolase [Syntrophorhabdaceae bacterium]|nr:nucleoside triphosphate pyrophosphohydrolase [Syntrophorhabdaceae bacterium]MDD5244559.1 nucleoside triphosphate pyrophosphohydrolase [Syntrophorhabdaceae bacterium]
MKEFSKLVELVATLRGEKGCPWDRKQTLPAFKTFLLEEVYELIDAIEQDNTQSLREELGDLLFHIIFIARICEEQKRFDIKDILETEYRKMYNRHPHVFLKESSEKPVQMRWEEIKKEEKEDYSLLSNIPVNTPALLRAYIITKRAARVGFDWEKLEDIYEKMHEEIGELKKAEETKDTGAIKEEIGDLLFTIVNISRFHNIDPEDALRSTSEKFIRRFNYIEKNIDVTKSSLTDMDNLWDEIKNMERQGD